MIDAARRPGSHGPPSRAPRVRAQHDCGSGFRLILSGVHERPPSPVAMCPRCMSRRSGEGFFLCQRKQQRNIRVVGAEGVTPGIGRSLATRSCSVDGVRAGVATRASRYHPRGAAGCQAERFIPSEPRCSLIMKVVARRRW